MMQAESSSETMASLYQTARRIIASTLIFKCYFSTLFSQEIPWIVDNPNVHCTIGNSAPSVPNMSHINPINTNPIWVRSILILFSHLSLSLPKGLFSAALRKKPVNKILFCHMHATCPSHFIRLDMITLMASGENSKRWRLLLTQY